MLDWIENDTRTVVLDLLYTCSHLKIEDMAEVLEPRPT